jgi:hypothetical protein
MKISVFWDLTQFNMIDKRSSKVSKQSVIRRNLGKQKGPNSGQQVCGVKFESEVHQVQAKDATH